MHPPTPVPVSPRPAQVYESVLTQMQISQPPPAPITPVETHDKFQTISIMETESVTLRCKSTGHHNPTITWTKNDKLLIPGQSVYKIEIRPEESTLLINNAAMEDAGWYQCTVTSPAGTTSIRGKVIVQPLPPMPQPQPRYEVAPVPQFQPVPSPIPQLRLAGTTSAQRVEERYISSGFFNAGQHNRLKFAVKFEWLHPDRNCHHLLTPHLQLTV